MNQYPSDLYKAMARDILNKKNGKKEVTSFSKLATLEEGRNRFLKERNLNAEDFVGDKSAEKAINERKQLAEKQIQQYFKQQSSAFGGMTPQMESTRTKMLTDLDERSSGAARDFSIDRTQSVASLAPQSFDRYSKLSTDSTNALNNSHGRELGATVGGLAGAGIGLLAGKHLPKRSTGILQRVGGSAIGGVAGALSGGILGSNRDEKRTGFNHEDVLKPYEVANKIQSQAKFS